jgi:hypothetical protein
MAKILKAENIQTDVLGSNGNSAFSLQRNSSSLLTLHTNDCVGINTTSPSHLLEVRGSSNPKIAIVSDQQLINQGASFRIDLKNASNQLFEAGTISIRHTASNQTAGAESAYMSFFTRNANLVEERMRILNTGSVGIGTTSPAARLHVAGGSIRLDDNSTLSWGGTANTILGNNASNYLRFTTNSVVSMVIDELGNVGIGTTSVTSGYVLDSRGWIRAQHTSGDCVIAAVAGNTTGVSALYFGDSASDNPGSVEYNHTSNYLYFKANAAERLRIDSSGNIIIGNGDTNASPANGAIRVTNASGTNISGSSITISAGAGTGTGAGGDIVLRTASAGSSGSSLNTLTERFRIDSSGDVGIGVTPSAWSTSNVALQIGGSTSIWTDKTAGLRTFISTNLFFDGTNRKYIATGAASEYLQGTDGAHVFYNAASGSSGANASLTERLRIASAGQIGIGGANYGTSGQVLTSGGASAAPSWATNPVGFRNRIINGDMRIDQRNAGASQTFTAAAALAYSVDRFYGYCTGANVTGQRVAGTAPNQFAYQFTGASSVTAIGFGTRLEATNTIDLAGSTATLSVQLANSLLTTVTWTAFYANTADTFGTRASPTRTQIATGTFTVTSSLATYSAQISVPSAATTGIEIVFTVGAQTSGTWTIDNVQLEAGSAATEFERRPIGTELALCQRYFWKTVQPVNLDGYNVGGPQAYQYVCNPTTMRATPIVSSTFSGLSQATGAIVNASVHGFQASLTPTAGGRFTGVYDTGNTVSIEL